MRVVVVGGSGYVAGLVLPLLSARHEVTVFDRDPPPTAYPFVVGDATDESAIAAALTGADAVVHCAMGRSSPGQFDVNVKSVYLTLAAGVPHAVYISSLSVFADLEARRPDEQTPPDAHDPYGLTKRLGEEVCRAAVAERGMSINVLRLAWPTPDDVWPAWAPPWEVEPRLWRTPDGAPIHGTAASDVARAVLAALEYRDGFQLFHICGTRLWTVEKARRLLGWEPAYAG